jgi:hypothetical protein
MRVEKRGLEKASMSTHLDKSEAQVFVEGQQGVSRHGKHENLALSRKKSHAGLSARAHQASAIRRIVKEAEIAAENYQDPIQLVTNGYWSVPPDQRPANWKTMNIPEAPQ